MLSMLNDRDKSRLMKKLKVVEWRQPTEFCCVGGSKRKGGVQGAAVTKTEGIRHICILMGLLSRDRQTHHVGKRGRKKVLRR